MSEATSPRNDLTNPYATADTSGPFSQDEPWYLKALDVGSLPARGFANALYNMFSLPQHALESPAPMLDPEVKRQTTEAALDVGLMGMGAERPPGSLGIFGGPKSATADLPALAKAQAMWDRSAHPRDIWEQTGWWKGPGGDWRYEIPDEEASLIKPSSHVLGPQGLKPAPPTVDYKTGALIEGVHGPSFPIPLGEVLDHKALFDAYPDLKKLKVSSLGLGDIIAGVKGAYDESGKMFLRGGPSEDVLSTLLHETQHAVQHIEGFPKGGNIYQFLPADFDNLYKDIKSKAEPYAQMIRDQGQNPYMVGNILLKEAEGKDLMKWEKEYINSTISYMDPVDLKNFGGHYKSIADYDEVKNDAFDKYLHIAGEVEARLVQSRQRYTPEERIDVFPPATQGYPANVPQSISRYSFPPHFNLEPVDHDPFQR